MRDLRVSPEHSEGFFLLLPCHRLLHSPRGDDRGLHKNSGHYRQEVKDHQIADREQQSRSDYIMNEFVSILQALIKTE